MLYNKYFENTTDKKLENKMTGRIKQMVKSRTYFDFEKKT